MDVVENIIPFLSFYITGSWYRQAFSLYQYWRNKDAAYFVVYALYIHNPNKTQPLY